MTVLMTDWALTEAKTPEDDRKPNMILLAVMCAGLSTLILTVVSGDFVEDAPQELSIQSTSMRSAVRRGVLESLMLLVCVFVLGAMMDSFMFKPHRDRLSRASIASSSMSRLPIGRVRSFHTARGLLRRIESKARRCLCLPPAPRPRPRVLA